MVTSIITNGKVGISKSIPGATLDVVGNAYITSNLTVDTTTFHVDSVSNRVGIGKTDPAYTLDVNGTIYASGDLIAFSDERKKTNIEPIPNALEKVLQLRGVTFDKIDGDDRRHAGVIAQEVEKVLPEVVYTDKDGMKSVAYGNVIGLLIEAIKEIKEKNWVIIDMNRDGPLSLGDIGSAFGDSPSHSLSELYHDNPYYTDAPSFW